MMEGMRTAIQQIGKGIVEAVLDDSISDEEMDDLLAEDHEEINALLQEAYDAKERGEFAPLEPLHVLLAEERARFLASQG
jgi:hypothetical protein